MGGSTHIVGKQQIRLRYSGSADPLALRQLMAEVCNDELPARLSALLERFDVPDQVITIDRLDVRISLVDDGKLKEHLAAAILEEVELQLSRKVRKGEAVVTDLSLNVAQTLSFYLLKGFLPAHSTITSRAQLLEELAQTLKPGSINNALARELLVALRSVNARVRLAALLDEQLFILFLEAFPASYWTAALWHEWVDIVEWLASSAGGDATSSFPLKQSQDQAYHWRLKMVVLELLSRGVSGTGMEAELINRIGFITGHQDSALFKRSSEEPSGMPESFGLFHRLQQAMAERRPGRSIQVEPTGAAHAGSEAAQKSADAAEKNPQPAEGNSILIQNSGLIILALYLPVFFRNVGLLDDGGKIMDDYRAVALLRYLVFEEEPFSDLDVVLEKILCGIPLEKALPGSYQVTAEEKQASAELLGSVLLHWSALKNTSPDGLRYNFLQREGKLYFNGQNWRLSVHRAAHDVLLDYLPWNISMVKLSWMPRMLTVNWKS